MTIAANTGGLPRILAYLSPQFLLTWSLVTSLWNYAYKREVTGSSSDPLVMTLRLLQRASSCVYLCSSTDVQQCKLLPVPIAQ